MGFKDFLGFNVCRLDTKYHIHDTPFPLPDHLQQCADYSIATNPTN